MKIVYDLETIAGVFTYTGLDIETKEVYQFVLHPKRFELEELINHLDKVTHMIGYNNLAFDYPILHYILKSYKNWLREIKGFVETTIITLIYQKAQSLIEQQNNSSFGGFGIRESEVLIPQMDLFKMWHFNNPARSQSLKGLEIAMNYHNVLDMSISHTETNISLENIKDILHYNLNDVLATFAFYELSTEKIELRKNLQRQYGIRCINYPDSKIGESLILKLYCEKTGLSIWDVRKMRTKRNSIALNDCIPNYIRFKTPEFNKLLNTLKSKIITETKGAIKESVIFNGFKYDFGTGGVHGCIKSGVYESDNELVIIDFDVSGMYPSIAIVNDLYPEHLGPVFCEVYKKEIVEPRMIAKKNGNMSISNALKLAGNATYGKSNDEYSFLYDPLYTMRTTLIGQLVLSMLCEKINLEIEVTMIQINTDGATMIIKRSDLDKYYSICKQWEKLTKLDLEYIEYSKMIIRDVNNYTSISIDNKIKRKGDFELEKELHKDNSFKVITLALSEYFINNIPVEDTIRNHKNIYDFCGRQKFKSDSYGVTYELIAGDIYPIKQQKNVRYYISKKGHKFIKHYNSGKQAIINEGIPVIIFNQFIEKENYDIDYDYYIRKVNEQIRTIVTNQLELF